MRSWAHNPRAGIFSGIVLTSLLGGVPVPPGSTIVPEPAASESDDIRDSQPTTCCIVGGGPGGMMLALLLSGQRIPVTLLEQHKDFDRDFGATRFILRSWRFSTRSVWLSRCI